MLNTVGQRSDMVQTRKSKKAAAADDGPVKENKALQPPATQQKRRGRPPKIRPETKIACTSKPINDIKKEASDKVEFESQDSCDSGLTNDADSFLDREEQEDKALPKQISQCSPLEKSKIPPPPPISKRRSSAKLKETSVKKSLSPETVRIEEPTALEEKPVAQIEIECTSEEPEALVELEDPDSKQTLDSAIEALPRKTEEAEIEMEQEPTVSSSLPPVEHLELNIPLPGTSSRPEDSMEIADSESERDSPPTVPEIEGATSPQKELHVDVGFNSKLAGLPSWEQSDSLRSPPPRPRIHFLHPAFGSFAGSDQPPPPPEPAPLKETENGFVIGFKPMAFKSGKIGATSNPLAKQTSPPPLAPDSPSKASQGKRDSNFGTAPTGSEIPPPQMVERPKLSFFNMPATTPSTASVFASDDDSEERPPEKKILSPLPVPAPPPIAAAKIADAEDDKFQAAKARAERAAQDIQRRYAEERHDREEQDRRREERERRHKRADEERAEQSRQREEERRTREKDREREAVRRQEREETRREEERKQREEDQKARDEERKAREEERRKCEEKKFKEEEMKVPEYELISECKFLMKCAGKRRTESLICECFQTGGNCSDNSCVNRAMNTECPSTCPAKCKNQRFAKRKYAAVEAFHTGTAKGCGLRALKDIKKGRFIIEYVGEVVERDDYEKRKLKYAADKKHTHHYLCDTGVYTIDATVYGNPSRFVNHSCDPNAVCERWSVPKTPGHVDRVGFFAKRLIQAGEEITFDYQFVNYGRKAQQCYCGSPNCNGWIGQILEMTSDEEDEDEDIVTTRHINMDEEEEQKLVQLQEMAPHERIKLIDEMLADLVIRNKKHARKVITIAAKMTDHKQRKNLLRVIFSSDTSLGTQQYYAKDMATLISEWMYADDYSVDNLKLVQAALKALHKDVFVSCAKDHSFLQQMVSRWCAPSTDELVDLHVVASSLVTCVAEPEKVYSDVAEATNDEIRSNFNRVKEMALRLNQHWFNRSVNFRIPKKVRNPSPSPKELEEKAPEASRISSPTYQRHHSSSSFYERDSHPRFFNNGNDVHQYRFAGYHGNNYMVNYQKKPYMERRDFRDSYRDRRRFGRRSRSRSRSHSPQAYKRRKLEDRETRHRSPSPNYERHGSTAGKTPTSTESPPDRFDLKNIAPKENGLADVKEEGEVAPHAYQYQPHPAAAPYSMGYDTTYNFYDPAMYMYHHAANGYYQQFQPHMAQVLTVESLPSNEKLAEMYERFTIEQLAERQAAVEQDLHSIKSAIAKKRAEAVAVEAVRRANDEAARLAEEASRFVWAKAKVAETGEVYYYNKVTKETQWSPPSAEQGLLDPSDRTSPDTTTTSEAKTANAVQEQHHLQSEAEATETVNDVPMVVAEPAVVELSAQVEQPVVSEHVQQTVPEEIVPSVPTEQPVFSNHSAGHKSSSYRDRDREKERDRDRDRDRERDRDRDRRDGSHHRDSHRKHSNHRHSSSHRSSEFSERRIREYKSQMDAVVRNVVKSCSREMRNSTADKIQWLIRMVVKEMFKRESSVSGFDCHMSETAERKIRNYTKNLIERKLKSDDLWKGYSEH